MIIVTGGAGFIGSCIIKELNNKGKKDIIVVDELGTDEKWKNLVNLKFKEFIHKDKLFDFLHKTKNVKVIIHMGACSSTTEKNADYLMENNVKYSQKIYDWCLNNDSRLIYASSAATYGAGELGYEDNLTDELKPLNMYGYSKKLFDQFVNNSQKLKQCVGLRFFNVFGPNENHKGSMASMVFHGFHQIKTQGYVNLFKSYKKEFKDGQQTRDFIYVKDICKVVIWMMNNPDVTGIFNVGTGKTRTFYDLIKSIFLALNITPNIKFIEMPNKLKGKYQYFTKANISKLRSVGYKEDFFELEDAIKDYVLNYLDKNKFY